MITALELVESPYSGASIIRCYRLKLGDQTIVLLSDEDNRMLAVCAHRLTSTLLKWLEARDLREPHAQCAGLQCVLGVGFVYASYAAAGWIYQMPRLIRELQKIVRPVLLGEQQSAVITTEGGVL